eukprot:764165-Hanusia_phi.AAC.3
MVKKKVIMSAESDGNDEKFTGGEELAIRMMISRNRMARQEAEGNREYVPFDVAVKWARKLKLWRTKEEWDDWIRQNKETFPYIPPDPEDYYKNRGVWLGWSFWTGESGDEEHS